MSETLSKFGVPMPDGQVAVLAQKLQHRFRVRLSNFGALGANVIDLSRNVNKVSRPSIKFNDNEIHSYNSRIYHMGKHEWETIDLDVRDDVTNAVQKLVNNQLQKQLNVQEQTGYLAGVNYKFQMWIDVMDGSANGVLETWFLEGCWLTNIKYGELDYEAGKGLTINMTIRFDNATVTNGATADGVANPLMDAVTATGSGFTA